MYPSPILSRLLITSEVSLNLLNLVQNLIISLGLLIGSLIVALRVTRGQSSTGDFIIFITYLTQLYGPLNMLGTTYRAMNQSLVDTEKLLNLLNEPTDVNDKPDAKDFVVENGEIEFSTYCALAFACKATNRRLQRTSTSRTMAARLPCAVCHSRCRRARQLRLSVTPARANRPSFACSTAFTTWLLVMAALPSTVRTSGT